jgi:hypothetical protein
MNVRDDMQRIFISYSRKDISFVRKLAGDLETAGYDVWWDVSDLRGGDDWLRIIPAAIESSDHFIVVLSPNAVTSDWVKREYTQALSLRKKIIPIMLTRSSVPFALNTLNYIDFTGRDYDDNLKALLDTLGYKGELPVTPTALPLLLRKYWIPIVIGFGFLLALLSTFVFAPSPEPSLTPTRLPSMTPIIVPTHTFTTTATVSPTDSPTITPSPTISPTFTETPTAKPTLTASPTNPTFEILIYCVNSLYANTINVRSGPGTIYAPIGDPLQVGTCLAFNARNEEETWLQIAPLQMDDSLLQYAGGWIYRDLLGLGTTGHIDLPAVTLTPTPTPSETPTTTPTLTPSETPSPTETPTLTEMASPTP